MSQFDKYTRAEYVEALRVFMRMKKQGFLQEAGLAPVSDEPRKGRMPRYADEPVAALEQRVNEKAARCEASDTTQGERLRLARDYKALSDSDIAREFGVSRELVRQWGEGLTNMPNVAQVAAFLDVPEAWLAEGGAQHLPANSHLGVRVGAEALQWREQLYTLTTMVLSEIPEDADLEYAQAYIEWAVFNKEEFKHVARRAGGRWQAVGGTLLFAPWVPIPEHGLTRRFWSDEVEAIIQEELATRPSVYGAWEAMRKRCEAMGLTPDQYPKRISLHKRIEKERERAATYGVDLNSMISASVAKYARQH